MVRTFLLFCALLLATGAAAGQRVALVIANGNTASLPALAGCAASASTVGAALHRAGFAVTDKADVSNGEMGSAIADFTRALAPGDAAVLYVCGYTLDFGGRDFLLPASANIERDSDALTQGLAAKSVLDAVGRSTAAAKLVLLDLVTAPKAGSPSHLDALTKPPLPLGFVAAVNAAVPPQGASAFAAAVAGALAGDTIDLGTAVTKIAEHAGSPGVTLTVGTPWAPAWLVGGPPAPAAAAPQAPIAAAPATVPDEAHMTEADRRQIQSALLRLGYYDRAADGIFGAETRAAIRRFQHEIGADMTGVITPTQAARLLGGTH